MRRALLGLACLAGIASVSASVRADTYFINSVVSSSGLDTAYGANAQGQGGTSYAVTSAIIGEPSSLVDSYNDPLTPFDAAYGPSQIVAVTPGGSIEVKLAGVASATGFDLGIHTASGLNDASYPNGTNFSPAETYTNPRISDVQVSLDGSTWVDLGTLTMDNPTSFYAQGSTPYGPETNAVAADFGKPFTGNIATFNGLDWQQTLNALNGSAGGTWLDLGQTGLTGVQYVKFTVPTNAANDFFLQTVVGITPEPGTLALLAIGSLGLLNRRRRSVRAT